MARKPRLSVPGALHHVMARGIEGREIFSDERDRRVFLSMLGEGIRRTGFLCYAWALMDNHYHLLLRCNERPLSELMRRLNGSYGRYYRKRHGQRGYVFQDRFKSIVTQDQDYIEELVRYIHLNPIRGGDCATLKELDLYDWCGHATLMGTRLCGFQNVVDVARRFGRTITESRTNYRRFMEEGLRLPQPPAAVALVRGSNRTVSDTHEASCWVIGNQEFVSRALAHDRERRIRLAEHQRLGVSITDIAERICHDFGIGKEDLLKRGRLNARSTARKAFIAAAHRQFGLPLTRIASFLGVSLPAVSARLGEGEAILAARSGLSAKASKISPSPLDILQNLTRRDE